MPVPARAGQQPAGFHIGRLVDSGGDALAQQVQQKGLLASRRGRQQVAQGAGLLGAQGQGRYAQGFAFGSGGAVVGEEGAGNHGGRAGRGWDPGERVETHC